MVIELCFNLLEGSRFVSKPQSLHSTAIADYLEDSLTLKCCKFSLPGFLTRTLQSSAKSYGYSVSVLRATRRAYQKNY